MLIAPKQYLSFKEGVYCISFFLMLGVDIDTGARIQTTAVPGVACVCAAAACGALKTSSST